MIKNLPEIKSLEHSFHYRWKLLSVQWFMKIHICFNCNFCQIQLILWKHCRRFLSINQKWKGRNSKFDKMIGQSLFERFHRYIWVAIFFIFTFVYYMRVIYKYFKVTVTLKFIRGYWFDSMSQRVKILWGIKMKHFISTIM